MYLDLNETPRRNWVSKVAAERVCGAIDVSSVGVHVHDNVDITVVLDPDRHVAPVAGVRRMLNYETFHDLVLEIDSAIDVIVRDDGGSPRSVRPDGPPDSDNDS